MRFRREARARGATSTSGYQRLLNEYGDEHRERTTVAAINGRSIWPVECKYGRMFAVQGSNVALATLDGAIAHARTLPEAKSCSE